LAIAFLPVIRECAAILRRSGRDNRSVVRFLNLILRGDSIQLTIFVLSTALAILRKISKDCQ
jgi:hypothetical protein